jgi:uncharacterized protein YndB with AHSA1/START domain
MTVKKDRDGNRYVAAEVEVHGTPEEVWQAIATGKGISSWFVPTTCDEREGGRTVSTFGPGMDAMGVIRRWNPPETMLVESETGEAGPGKVATEWIVEARSGGTCVVRVVHRWFAESDDWDGEFEGHAYGWVSSFFRILRLYVAHFSGQQCTAIDLAAFSQSSGKDTWRQITDALQIDSDTGKFESAPNAPSMSGQVESTEVSDPELLRARERAPQVVAALEGMGDEDPQLLLRLDRPAGGVAHFFIMNLGTQTMVTLRFFLYGDHGAKAAPDFGQAWTDWLEARFSMEPFA